MKKIFLGHHFFGAGNVGDDLMLAGFLRAIRGKLHQLSFACAIPHPLSGQMRRFPEIQWIPYEEGARRQMLADSDVWLGLGGSPFQSDDSEWFTEHLQQEAEWCRELRLPMYFLGVGVNNAEVLRRPDIRAFLRQAQAIWARDERSHRLLCESGESSEKVFLGSDLSHVELANFEFPSAPKQSLGYCLNFHEDLERVRNSLVHLLQRARGLSQFWHVQEVRDLPQGERRMHALLSHDEQSLLSIAVPDYEANSIAAIIASLPPRELFVSSRYHASILQAWSGGKLSVLAINDKLRGIAEELRVPCYDSLDEIDPKSEQSFLPVPREHLESLSMRAYGSVIAFLSAIGAGEERENEGQALPVRLNGGEKILLVCPDSLGDMVLREPLASFLLSQGFSVTVASRRPIDELLPSLNEKLRSISIPFHPYIAEQSLKDSDGVARFIKQVRAEAFDLFIFPAYNRTLVEEVLENCFPQTSTLEFSPGVASVISLHQVLPEIASEQKRKQFRVKVEKNWHEAQKLQALLGDGLGFPDRLPAPKITLSQKSLALAEVVLKDFGLSSRRFIISCPLGTKNVPKKSLPLIHSVAGLGFLHKKLGMPILLIGVESEREGLQIIRSRLHEERIPAEVWIGEDEEIPTLLGLLAQARCYFGGDTGPMHMAAALRIPVFAIFGGGTFPRFLPLEEHARIAVERQSCFACDWACVFPEPYCFTRISESSLRADLEGFLEQIPTSSA